MDMQACECEHVAHTERDKGAVTPHGNPAHVAAYRKARRENEVA